MSLPHAYAKAFHDTLVERKKETLASARRELLSFVEAMEGNKSLRTIMTAPMMTATEKEKVLAAVGAKLGLGATTLTFLKLLLNKGRIGILSKVSEALDKHIVETDGGTLGEIRSVDALTEEVVQEFEQAFRKKVGKTVSFRQKRDPSLLAGVKVTIDGTTYDGSLRSQLDRLRETLLDQENVWN